MGIGRARAIAILGAAGLWANRQVLAEMRTTQVGSGNYGRSTTVGDNREPFNPVTALQNQGASGSQPAGSSGGGAPATPTGIVIDGHVPRVPTFKERVAAAKATMDPRMREQLARQLREGDGAAQVAVLSFENDGVLKLREAELIRVLENTRQEEVARAALVLLNRRATDEAYAAMEKHVADRGPADELAIRFLWAAGHGRGKAALMDRASQATGRDEAALLAIQALAGIPGNDVTALLRRLLEDWSPEVSTAAQKAREQRKGMGLPVDLTAKPPPLGAPISSLLEDYDPSQHNRNSSARGVTIPSPAGPSNESSDE